MLARFRTGRLVTAVMSALVLIGCCAPPAPAQVLEPAPATTLVHPIAKVDKRVTAMLSLSAGVTTDTDPVTKTYNAQGYPRAFRPNPAKGTSPSKFLIDWAQARLDEGYEKLMIKGLPGSTTGQVSGNIPMRPEIEKDIRDKFVPWWKAKVAANPALVLCYYTGSVASPNLSVLYATKDSPSCLDTSTPEARAVWRQRNQLPIDMGATEFYFDWASSSDGLTQQVYDCGERLAGSILDGGPSYHVGSEAWGNAEFYPYVTCLARSTYAFESKQGQAIMNSGAPPGSDLRFWAQTYDSIPSETRDDTVAYFKMLATAKNLGLIAQNYTSEIAQAAREINDPAVLCLHN